MDKQKNTTHRKRGIKELLQALDDWAFFHQGKMLVINTCLVAFAWLSIAINILILKAKL